VRVKDSESLPPSRGSGVGGYITGLEGRRTNTGGQASFSGNYPEGESWIFLRKQREERPTRLCQATEENIPVFETQHCIPDTPYR